MYCPYCSYTSFDHLPVCPKCNYDWSKEQQLLGLDCFQTQESQEKNRQGHVRLSVNTPVSEATGKGQGLTTALSNDFTGKE